MNSIKKALVKSILLLFLMIIATVNMPHLEGNPSILTVTAKTNRQYYLLRQKVTIEGNVSIDGTPADDLMITIQIDNPRGSPLLIRTLNIGNPTPPYTLNITQLYLTDTLETPINTIKAGSMFKACINIHNKQLSRVTYFVTITIFDANMVPIACQFQSGTIDQQTSLTAKFSIYMPKWATSGKALLVGNVYSKMPKEEGIAYSNEMTTYFCISKTQHGYFELPEISTPTPNTSPGQYRLDFHLPPDPFNGTYQLFVKGQKDIFTQSSTTTYFEVQNSNGYPPQASFIYWPSTPFVNQTVEFDASYSTPEGFKDTITKYEWNFGDGTIITVTDPTITHNYLQPGTYIVTLNVTDNEGLWSATSKPIKILPEFNPIAIFEWTPPTSNINQTVTFNASASIPGWSKQLGDFAPITSFTWNFSGIIIGPLSNPTVNYVFSQPGNFTITLTVEDSVGRTNSTSRIIEVLNQTRRIYDVAEPYGKIDMKDVAVVARAFGTQQGDPNWNPMADITGPNGEPDGKVDMRDVSLVARHFGEEY